MGYSHGYSANCIAISAGGNVANSSFTFNKVKPDLADQTPSLEGGFNAR